MNDFDALKRLHQKGWQGKHLNDVCTDGVSALMKALQHPDFKTQPYTDQGLVEVLLARPDFNPHHTDEEGHNAFWYSWDFQHAYPLLHAKRVDINLLNLHGEHFLVKWAEANAMSEKLLQPYQKKLELAVELGLDTTMMIQGKCFIELFPDVFQDTLERAVRIKTEKTLLSTLPPAEGIKTKSPKL